MHLQQMVINGIRKSKAGQEAGERWGACLECSGVHTAPLSDRGLSASKFYINYNRGGGGSELGTAFLGGWDWQCPESSLTGGWGTAPRSTTPGFPLERSPGGVRTGMTTGGKWCCVLPLPSEPSSCHCSNSAERPVPAPLVCCEQPGLNESWLFKPMRIGLTGCSLAKGEPSPLTSARNGNPRVKCSAERIVL